VIVRLTSRPWLGVVLALWWAGCLPALALGYARLPAGAEGPNGEVRTGDFVAFYGAAVLVARGEGTALYDEAAQTRAQAELGATGVRPFFYPASVAVVLAPLARLSYRAAFLVTNAALVVLGLVAAGLLAPLVPRLRERGALLAFAAAAGFAPVLRTWLAGGQTTVVTLALFAGASAAALRGRWAACGLAVGLLAYKPQLVLPLGVVLVAWRAWTALGAAAAVGLGHWALGALACGPGWPLALLRGLAWYQPREVRANGATDLSFGALCARLLPGALAPWAALLLTLATLALLVALSAPAARRTDPRARRLAWAFALAASLLTTAHTQHYDVGLVVAPVLLLLEQDLADGRAPSVWLRLGLVVGFVAYPAYELGDRLGVQPLLLWPLAVCAWAVLRVVKEAPATSSVERRP
jgi:hypothetical protein